MVRAAYVFRPTHVVIENVSSVLRAKEGVVDTAVESLTAMGYDVVHAVVPVVRLGIPQLRKRHVLVASTAFMPEISAMLADFGCDHARDLRWAIGDLEDEADDSIFARPSSLSPENVRRAKWMLANEKFDLPNWLRPRCHRDKPTHRYKSMYGRLHWKLPAHTITSGFLSPGQGRYLHPTRVRTITPHEAARIQFFPDWFDFSTAAERTLLAEAIGNAVPPKLTFAIVSHLLGGARADEVDVRAAVS
jgi:DNA (cytosine-5)-methyltransferase 1